jgi:hypothetical protein
MLKEHNMLNPKSEALNPKQGIEKGLCCSFYGVAARMVLRRSYA